MNNSNLSGSCAVWNSKSHQNNKIVICALLWIHYHTAFNIVHPSCVWGQWRRFFSSICTLVSNALDIHVLFLWEFSVCVFCLFSRSLCHVFISVIPCIMSGTLKWFYLWRYIYNNYGLYSLLVWRRWRRQKKKRMLQKCYAEQKREFVIKKLSCEFQTWAMFSTTNDSFAYYCARFAVVSLTWYFSFGCQFM